MSNYPPGVSGNEPEITGIWDCRVCDGAGYDEDEDGKHPCRFCGGSGKEPEEPPYCLNCDNTDWKTLYRHTKSGIMVCDACKDIDEDDLYNWEEY